MPPRYAYWTIILDGSATAFRARELDDLLPTLHQLKKKSADATIKWFAAGRLWDSPDHAREAQAREEALRARKRREEGDAAWRKAIDELREKRLARERAEGKGAAHGEQEGRGQPERREQSWRGGAPQRRDKRGGAPQAQWRGKQEPRPGIERPGDSGRRGAPERHPGQDRPPAPERRGKDWRPGGEHRDPRDKYKGPPGQRRKRWKERFFRKRREQEQADSPPLGHPQKGAAPFSGRGGRKDGRKPRGGGRR